jgi:hypothetical protein
MAINRFDWIKGYPDVSKRNKWKRVKVSDMFNTILLLELDIYNLVVVHFSDLEIPKIRRAIDDNINWYSDNTYNWYKDIQSLESFLKIYAKKNVAVDFKVKLAKDYFTIKTRIQGWELVRFFLLYSTENWLIPFFIHHWNKFMEKYIQIIPQLITYEEDFAAKASPNPKGDLPVVSVPLNSESIKQTKLLVNIRCNSIANSKLMISLSIQLLGSISYDFIIWKRLIGVYNKYKFEHPPNMVNCNHPLQINYDSHFVINYTNSQKENAQF